MELALCDPQDDFRALQLEQWRSPEGAGRWCSNLSKCCRVGTCRPAKSSRSSSLSASTAPDSPKWNLPQTDRHKSSSASQLNPDTQPQEHSLATDRMVRNQPILQRAQSRLHSRGPGPYLHLMKRLEYGQIKRQELLLNVAGPKRSFCARNLPPNKWCELGMLLQPALPIHAHRAVLQQLPNPAPSFARL